jgi:hypothetical protein
MDMQGQLAMASRSCLFIRKWKGSRTLVEIGLVEIVRSRNVHIIETGNLEHGRNRKSACMRCVGINPEKDDEMLVQDSHSDGPGSAGEV